MSEAATRKPEFMKLCASHKCGKRSKHLCMLEAQVMMRDFDVHLCLVWFLACLKTYTSEKGYAGGFIQYSLS